MPRRDQEWGHFRLMAREGLSKEATLALNPGWSEPGNTQRQSVPAEAVAGAKALGKGQAWSAPATARQST